MELVWYKDNLSFNTIINIVVSDDDKITANKNMSNMDKYCMNEWTKSKSSIEEKLMALQLIARYLTK